MKQKTNILFDAPAQVLKMLEVGLEQVIIKTEKILHLKPLSKSKKKDRERKKVKNQKQEFLEIGRMHEADAIVAQYAAEKDLIIDHSPMEGRLNELRRAESDQTLSKERSRS